jgi:hypothetical protein
MTRCGKCEGAAFKVQEISPSGSAYKMYSIQCSACQTPIGVTEFYSVGALLKSQEKVIADLGKKISQIENAVSQIARAMR